MQTRHWDGRTVHVARLEGTRDPRCVEVGLTPETARELALALRRLQQTSLANAPAVDELVNALDYVLVGDPHSRAQHAALERAKDVRQGPTDADFAREHRPRDGDLRRVHGNLQEFGEGRWHPVAELPKHEFVPHASGLGEYRCGYVLASGFCWKTKEEHGG